MGKQVTSFDGVNNANPFSWVSYQCYSGGLKTPVALFFSLMCCCIISREISAQKVAIESVSPESSTLILSARPPTGADSEAAVLVSHPGFKTNESGAIREIAYLKLLRNYPEKSLWEVSYAPDWNALREGTELLLYTRSDLMRGRVRRKVGRSTLIAPEQQATEQLRSFHLYSVEEEFRRLSAHPIAVVGQDKARDTVHYRLADVEQWSDNADGPVVSETIYRSPLEEDFRESKRQELFKSIVEEQIRKANQIDYSPVNIYREYGRELSNNQRFQQMMRPERSSTPKEEPSQAPLDSLDELEADFDVSELEEIK